MNTVSSRGKTFAGVCRDWPAVVAAKGQEKAKVFSGSAADLGGSGPWPDKELHWATASQMRPCLILIERPSREEPDRAGLALSFGPLAGDGGAPMSGTVPGHRQRLGPRLLICGGGWPTTRRTAIGAQTFVAALRITSLTVPGVIDGAMDGDSFRADVEKILVPTLDTGDIVVADKAA
jgi:hypothetical protein